MMNNKLSVSSFQFRAFRKSPSFDLKAHPAKLTPQSSSRGFTLIEMMVAVSIFAITILISVGALLSLSRANQRAQAINAVMNNVNAAIENMSRSMRVGYAYHCENSFNPTGDITTTQNCATDPGGILLAFEPSNGDQDNPNDQVMYRFNSGTNQIERSLSSGAAGSWIAITAPPPEVVIDSLQFFVDGAGSETLPALQKQPRILMIVKGSAVTSSGSTEFTVQSSVTQRRFEI